MGFFKKKKHNLIENNNVPGSESSATTEAEIDDFDFVEDNSEITREEFHKMAEENLQDAIDDGSIEAVVTDEDEDSDTEADSSEVVTDAQEPVVSDADESTDDSDDKSDQEPQTTESSEDIATDDTEPDNDDAESDEETDEIDIESETDVVTDNDDGDDFDDINTDSEPEQKNDEPLPEQKPKKQKEKKPRMTFREFCDKHRKALKVALIVFCVFFTTCLGIYIYGCATVPEGVMGRNIYIEDANVSGLTYDQALQKVKASALLDDCDITVTCRGQVYTINGIDVGLTARIEDTVEKAMQYGKSGNILIDGFLNALQVVTKHTVMPSANVSEPILRSKLTEFGNIVHGELVEHKLEVGDKKIICTPGHAGFSGDTDEAYREVIKAIENERFSRIRVSLKAAHPKTLTLEDIDAFVYATPQDARFEIKDNNVTVVPEVWGRYLDLEAVRPLISEIHEGGNVVNIPFNTSEPTIKAADLNQKLFNTTLGSFFTYYGGSTANRAANVANAASKINGKILAPGEVFSFNETVGKRSTANGFYTAPEYADGQTIMGIGGGTCQVSSTLYNAVLYADLSVVYRLNHMFTVGYCNPGQDATVSDSGVDFKFSNNTDYPIKISAVTSGGKITIDILGTERDVRHNVKIENYSSYSNGNRSVRTYRMVYDPQGNLLRKEEMPKSYYMSHE